MDGVSEARWQATQRALSRLWLQRLTSYYRHQLRLPVVRVRAASSRVAATPTRDDEVARQERKGGQ